MRKIFEPISKCDTCKHEAPNSTQETVLVVVTSVASLAVTKAIKYGFKVYVNSRNGDIPSED
ncbi:hypothetical protein KC887_02315 [Candidatus Kaiserbacteria bacterium]|nr:hypothetical protein [Candidatus Kaiserbacteria bacterium]